MSLQYFHLRDEEHAILEMLDGRTGLAAIKAHFENARASRLPLETIHAFLGRLHECGLLLSDAPGQGEELLKHAPASAANSDGLPARRTSWRFASAELIRNRCSRDSRHAVGGCFLQRSRY